MVREIFFKRDQVTEDIKIITDRTEFGRTYLKELLEELKNFNYSNPNNSNPVNTLIA